VIDLFMSTEGEGRPDCLTYAPLCLDLLAPQLYAEGFTDELGEAMFELHAEDFLETGEVAWQPVSYNPLSGEPFYGFVAIRHVAVSSEEADLALVRVTDTVGLGMLDTAGNSHTGGAIWFDYDNDLWTDLLVTNGGGAQNMLFRNDGDGTFTRIMGAIDKPRIGLEPAGAIYADVDVDGDHDVFIPVDNAMLMDSSLPQPREGGPNLLYLNDAGVFVESGAISGLVDPRGWRTSAAAFADYDADGCIDVFLGNWAMAVLPANDNYSRLMHGNCDGTFDDVTALTGVDGEGRDALTALWWDANLDGFPDLYVGNVSDKLALPDFDPTSSLYYNLGGVSFEDQIPLLQPWLALDSWAAMGADVADIDLDGDWDLYVTDVFDIGIAPRGNALYLGSAEGTLSANRCREHEVCGGYNAWPTGFADFNRDTWPDLWVGAALPGGTSLLYVNKGDGTFEHHEQPELLFETMRGGSLADYDGDGDVDVFTWMHGGGSELFRNDPVDTHHWLEIKLEGNAGSSWDAIGATVYVTAGGVTQMRRVSGGDSAHSQSDAILHFGLGDEEMVELVEVVWPVGTVQVFTDVVVDDIVRISELDGILTEALPTVVATYNAATDVLFVEARSTYVGRTDLTVEGFGPLQYSAVSHAHSRSFFGVTTKPDDVTVTSARGAARTKTVTLL
jgi:hypothetical protein